MKSQSPERLVLIGPSGSGKTTVARQVAALLRWSYVDTDDLVTRVAGMPIRDIFAASGEPRFRELESQALAEALSTTRTVIATGAGIVERAENVAQMRSAAWVVALTAPPRALWQRIQRDAETAGAAPGEMRPMLAEGDPSTRIHELYERRKHLYQAADETMDVEALPADEVAARIVAHLVARGLLPRDGTEPFTRSIRTPAEAYTSVVEWGGLASLGRRLAELHLPPRLHVVADATVADLYASVLLPLLERAGFEPDMLIIPPGETSKSREQLNRIHDWLADRRAERTEAMLALGGGVVGDLAGFAAATYLRGVPYISVPTSLLAQVDASIGGKTAIDHPRGKNLIGAFYPPRLVLADPATLLTLPTRQRIEGWAEVIKHGVALDAGYFAWLEHEAEALTSLHPAELTRAVALSVELKAGIVEGDEREGDGGQRALLNYGHTIGHALETVSGYGEWLHGEAVAIGMSFAARMGRALGVTPEDVVARQEALLRRFGLPTFLDGVPADALERAALWDKKVRSGRVRWVLPTALGESAQFSDVPESTIHATLLELGAR